MRYLITATYMLCFWGIVSAQNSLYFVGNGPGGTMALGQINLETCEVCVEMNLTYNFLPSGATAVVPLPGGNVVVIGVNGEVIVVDPPNQIPVSTFDLPGQTVSVTATPAPNGNVYIGGYTIVGAQLIWRIFEYNPINNTSVILGETTPNPGIALLEIFFWNGQLHAVILNSNVSPAQPQLVTVGLGNPMTFTLVNVLPGIYCSTPIAAIPSGPFAGIYGGLLGNPCSGTALYNYDYNNNTSTFQCDVLPGGYPYGLSAVPAGFPGNGCQCNTNAGVITGAATQLCGQESLSFSVSGGNLDPNDLREFVLFTNPADIVGSIVATSNTPVFGFAPPLQTGITNYFAAVAGNNLNGNVDLNDPCLNFSNTFTVVWNPLPTVSFTVGDPNLCSGECRIIELVFSGSPPFELSYHNGTSTSTQSFSGLNGSIEICVPANTPPGVLNIQALALTDFWCICN